MRLLYLLSTIEPQAFTPYSEMDYAKHPHPSPVPEPTTYGLIFIGLCIAFILWRKWYKERKEALHWW